MFGIGTQEVVAVLIFILAVLLILMPVFVYQIRNAAMKTNKRLDTIIGLLEGLKGR